MYKTHKNIIDVQLDMLETMIYSISSADEQKQAIVEQVRLYRQEFESLYINNGSSADLECRIRNFTVKVFYYLSGSKEDFSEEHKPLPKLHDSSKVEENPSVTIGLRTISDRLSSGIQKIDSIEDITQKIAALFSYEQMYMHIPDINDQSIEQAFSRIKYELMKKYLIQGDLIKARVLSFSFNPDMRLYITSRLEKQRQLLADQGRYKEAYEILEYISTDKGSIEEQDAPEKRLKFWETVIRMENPELDFSLPNSKKDTVTSDKSVLKKAFIIIKGLFKRKVLDKSKMDILEESQKIDAKGEQGESLIALLEEIKQLSQKIMYLKLGLETIDPEKISKRKHIDG